jgi:TIR domain
VKVFISHFSGDTWIARQIEKEIKHRGFDTFLDVVDVETGDVLEETIRENLDTSDELLVLLTPEALERPYIWMEAGAAWVQKKRIVGILYRLTAADVATRERTPALLKSIFLRDLNEIEEYLEELSRRATA